MATNLAYLDGISELRPHDATRTRTIHLIDSLNLNVRVKITSTVLGIKPLYADMSLVPSSDFG
jgi:hypothetical protein